MRRLGSEKEKIGGVGSGSLGFQIFFSRFLRAQEWVGGRTKIFQFFPALRLKFFFLEPPEKRSFFFFLINKVVLYSSPP